MGLCRGTAQPLVRCRRPDIGGGYVGHDFTHGGNAIRENGCAYHYSGGACKPVTLNGARADHRLGLDQASTFLGLSFQEFAYGGDTRLEIDTSVNNTYPRVRSRIVSSILWSDLPPSSLGLLSVPGRVAHLCKNLCLVGLSAMCGCPAVQVRMGSTTGSHLILCGVEDDTHRTSRPAPSLNYRSTFDGRSTC